MKKFSTARLLDEKLVVEMNKFFNQEEITQPGCALEPPSVENYILKKSHFHTEEISEIIEIDDSELEEPSEDAVILAENSLIESPTKSNFQVLQLTISLLTTPFII